MSNLSQTDGSFGTPSSRKAFSYPGKTKRIKVKFGCRLNFLNFILDKVLSVNNKRNRLKSKGLKVYSSKQSMKVLGVSKPKHINSG